jgi:hypothetical protein
MTDAAAERRRDHREFIEDVCTRIHNKVRNLNRHVLGMTVEQLQLAEVKINHDMQMVRSLSASSTDMWEQVTLLALETTVLELARSRTSLILRLTVHYLGNGDIWANV